ncbi:hypothetical protein TNCV_1338821 [Trichonephila clavipes]|nr:hypothetical protein TNCV_1338821 [Trichonephila clavipes]
MVCSNSYKVNLSTPSTSALTYFELYSLKKSQNLVEWRVLLTHHWCSDNRSGLVLALKVAGAPRLQSLVLPVVTSSACHSQANMKISISAR